MIEGTGRRDQSNLVNVPQDLEWEEMQAAVKLVSRHRDLKSLRAAMRNEVFVQGSEPVRKRYTAYFFKWFVPSGTLNEPVFSVWTAFADEAALRDVMRWQYLQSNPLFAGFVDGPLTAVNPGEAADEVLDSYLISIQLQLRKHTRYRMRTNLRKLGLLLEHKKCLYRIIPEVSPKAIVVLLAYLFAPKPQVIAWSTLVADPWWKRLGIVDEAMLRERLRATAAAGLIARVARMDTLDQVTTRYSLTQLQSGKMTAQ